MFFQVTLSRVFQLAPRFFGPQWQGALISKLYREVEGKCIPDIGYVIAVIAVDEKKDISDGLLIDGTPLASFRVKFKAIVIRPFKGEVLDAVVTDVVRHGFNAEAGPIKIFVSATNFNVDMTLQGEGETARFVSVEGKESIGRGDAVRLRVIGCRVSATDITCVGTLAENLLGVLKSA